MEEEHTTLKSIIGSASHLAGRAKNLAEAAPGADFFKAQAHQVEDLLLQRLKDRLDALNGGASYSNAISDLAEPAVAASMQVVNSTLSLAERMAAMMDRSLNQTLETAQQALFSKLLDQLVPDEIRILNAMSDGSRFAVCNIEAVGLLGSGAIPVLENLSRIGNESGVMLNDTVPFYLGRLRSLGLVEMGPADKDATTKYDMIENDSVVRETTDKIEKEMKMKVRAVRKTVYLSPLGARFISTCRNLGS